MRDGRGQAEQLPANAPAENGARPAPASVPQRTWPPGRSLRAVVALALLVVLAVFAAFYVTNLRISRRPSLTTSDVNAIVNQQVSTAISQLESQPPAAATAYQAVRAGLVVIEAQHQGAPGTEDLGTGVIVDTRGDILTALHVVQGASEINVTFADGTTSAAAITASDPTHDIAVLAAGRLPAVIVPAVLGPSPQIGDETFAVGNPLGLVGSLSAGVISGLDRTFKLGNGRTLSGMIQFDAAVNPGSSGGPLLNTKGQVIGIVTGLANAAGTDNFAGIGFAVPIATAGQAAGAPAK
ncbi:MAG: trypsin-like peptidase domain-containing protein [Acidimicrobiales bacterium]